jgi:hypothetical protein
MTKYSVAPMAAKEWLGRWHREQWEVKQSQKFALCFRAFERREHAKPTPVENHGGIG